MPTIQVTITSSENAEYFGVKVGDTVPVDFEEYVAGVTASELASGGMEACKAQAIAARTFAVARGVLEGEPISDSSSKAQAYRAVRCDPNAYPVPYKAAMSTSGMILTYAGKPANTVYTASNGGRTYSSQEVWGGIRAYLIAKDDPWDTYPKSGHGVGMSQLGARWAGQNGYTYEQILDHYYPGCRLTANYGASWNTKASEIVRLAKEQLGSPYVFGAIGEFCTPSARGHRVNANHPTIKSKCQVLMGKSSSCEGCRFAGKRMFDCRGLTYWVLAQVGIKISKVGATTQWKTAKDWMVRGPISEMPEAPCILFRQVGNKMEHTGIYIGDGQVIEASVDVQETSLPGRPPWTHYAIPNGLYTQEEYEKLKGARPLQTLRKGSTGDLVRKLQETLNQRGYSCGIVDGVYGTKTIAAVKAFQADQGLTPDGVCGPKTWEALNADEPETLYTVRLHNLTWSQVQSVRQTYPLAEVVKE